MKSTALPKWMYGDPQNIADGLIAESKRRDESEKKRFEIQLKQNRRRVRSLTKMAKLGRFK